MLSLVGTPIGNLGDITLRALETLRAADRDRLRGHAAFPALARTLRNPQAARQSFHEHNEARRTQELLVRLRAGENVAVITDAGLPSVSDPGARLVRACVEAGVPYTVIPGPSAVLTALGGFGSVGGEFLLRWVFAAEKRRARTRGVARVGT